jgi:hypothetical protein
LSVNALHVPMVLLVMSLLAACSAAALSRANGTVACARGQPVVGVWVDAGADSGWATLSGASGTVRSYSRHLSNSWTYTLNVGCGGSAQHWASSNSSVRLIVGATHHLICGGGRCSETI